ncbi:MAG: CarD family transcriptional regulator [Spirochaetales bacterium]|nr:CarD family transcriptional regulator [Spirochaetales bacterium]
MKKILKKAKKQTQKAAAKKTKKPVKTKAKAKKPAKKRVSKFKNLKYSLHQKIVYPLHGVGEITSIEERVFLGKKTVYYIIYLDVPDMTVMMPVTEADERGIRSIVHKKEALKALTVVAKDFQPVSADWKMRYQMNLELLKKGSVLDIAKVVRSLYNRSKIKELPILERKLFDNAIKLLIDEIAYSLRKEKDEVEAMIYKKMESK